MDSYFSFLNLSFVENNHISIFTAFAKQSMINRLSNPINRNCSAVKISKVMSSSQGGLQVRPREQGRRLGGHRGRQQCPRGSRWGVGVPRGQGVKGEVRGVPWGQEGGPWGHRDCRTIWHRTIKHRTIWHRTIWHQTFDMIKLNLIDHFWQRFGQMMDKNTFH